MSWKAPDAGNAEGLEIYAKVILPKSRADISVDDVHHVHMVRERNPPTKASPNKANANQKYRERGDI